MAATFSSSMIGVSTWLLPSVPRWSGYPHGCYLQFLNDRSIHMAATFNSSMIGVWLLPSVPRWSGYPHGTYLQFLDDRGIRMAATFSSSMVGVSTWLLPLVPQGSEYPHGCYLHSSMIGVSTWLLPSVPRWSGYPHGCYLQFLDGRGIHMAATFSSSMIGVFHMAATFSSSMIGVSTLSRRKVTARIQLLKKLLPASYLTNGVTFCNQILWWCSNWSNMRQGWELLSSRSRPKWEFKFSKNDCLSHIRAISSKPLNNLQPHFVWWCKPNFVWWCKPNFVWWCKPNFVWRCIIMSRSVMRTDWVVTFKVRFTVIVHLLKMTVRNMLYAPLNFLPPNFVWWHIVTRRSSIRKVWIALYKVMATVKLQILMSVPYLPNCWSSCSQTWFGCASSEGKEL